MAEPAIAVLGLWHLGTVTAACLAEAGFRVTGIDSDAATIAGLAAGRPPLHEPGLVELVARGLAAGRLSFTTDRARAASAGLVWITHDTPVDEEDRADSAFVEREVERLFPHLADGAVVLISAQLPVGTTRRLAVRFAEAAGDRRVAFAYSPENLRLGKAIAAFTNPERIVVGADGDQARAVLAPVLARFSDTILWMTPESAEMVKHALNAFLATSVTFINEIARICEQTGARADEVEEGLRSEPRIGRRAYVRPGPAFAGGTLARDVRFLGALAADSHVAVPLLDSILKSNEGHRLWPLGRLRDKLGALRGRRIAVLGLAYKPGTDAVRRSAAVALCRALGQEGAEIRTFDPAVAGLPPEIAFAIPCRTPREAVAGADAAIVMTEWPELRDLSPADCTGLMRRPLILDPGGYLAPSFGGASGIDYATVGRGT